MAPSLISKALFFVCSVCCCLSAIAQEYVFIGSFNWDKNKPGLYVYRLDTATGILQHTCTVDSTLNPSYLTIAPDGRHIYACTEAHTSGTGNVSSYAFDAATGTLRFMNRQGSGGENPVYVNVDKTGKWLINANYTEAGVSAYPVMADGSIGAISQLITFTDSSIDKDRQTAAHVHSAIFSPAQDYIFLPDLGADKVRCFAFHATNKQPLQAHGCSHTVPGSGPRHLVFHPNGRYAYCIEEMAGFVTAYKYSNGHLDTIQRIATHNHPFKDGYNSADIHISPDGNFLYASNRGRENNIAIYSISRQNGMLKLVGYQGTAGNHPRIFSLTPSGKFLIVANQISGAIVVFKRDMITGLLKKTGARCSVPGASCVQVRDYK